MPGFSAPDFLTLQSALRGRYSIERELGRGGMGIVYLAHEVSLDRPVALKLLPPVLAAQPGLRDRFLREARTAARLSHPNIVPIHAVDAAGDFVFFAMAFVDGETLGQRVRERGPLPPSEATRVLRDASWALAYAHAQGVVHRDVKPDNIMLERGGGRVLVTDFGIAHVREGTGTEAGEVLGTAEFMSPEQASGEPLDARSDIYALGCVGYFAVSGRLPFQGETVGGVLAKQIGEPAPLLSSVAPEVPSKLGRVIARCLHKAPADRFPSGEALAEALEQTAPVRRELPVALRVFVNQNRKTYNQGVAGGLIVLFMSGPLMGLFAFSGATVSVAFLAGTVGAILALPFSAAVRSARRLLRAGHDLDDAQLAMKEDVDRRREELLFEFGRPGWVDRLLKYTTIGTLSVTGAAFGGILMSGSPYPGPLLGVFGVSASAFMLSGLAYAGRTERRRDVWGERWLRFWKSRFGRWAFKVAGIGLKQVSPAATATYRPTELALGLAADHLYEALPKATKRALPDLPQVVRRLETDAQSMRRRVEELNDLLGQIGDDERAGSDRRARLRDELRATRDAAHQKMLDAVGALETIRLGLLRMQAGVATAESITQDLASARELLGDIERLAESGEEVEREMREL
jgi:serine/threonine-protein kinase